MKRLLRARPRTVRIRPRNSGADRIHEISRIKISNARLGRRSSNYGSNKRQSIGYSGGDAHPVDMHVDAKGGGRRVDLEPGKMFRSIHLPKRINPDKVKAESKNGLLRLRAEIAEETKVRKIRPEAA